MSQHTPGPWTAHDDDGTGTLPCVLSDKVNPGGNWYVAQCNRYEDARLIAAAPEMVEVLTHLLSIYDSTEMTYEAAYLNLKKPHQIWDSVRMLLASIHHA